MTTTDQPIGPTKRCTKCGNIKPITDFYIDSRWGTARSRCKKCTSADAVAYVKENPEIVSAASKRRRLSGNTKDRERNRRHYENNKTTELARAKNYRETNRDKYLESCKKSSQKKRATTMGRLTDAISRAIKRGLIGGSKAGRRAFEILPYTPLELKLHLEKQFSPGMNWSNYGTYGWHIDHIVPISSFSFETTDDRDFQACWALTNLRPMWRSENLSKGKKILTFI